MGDTVKSEPYTLKFDNCDRFAVHAPGNLGNLVISNVELWISYTMGRSSFKVIYLNRFCMYIMFLKEDIIGEEWVNEIMETISS